jgi:hypothetical protein
MLATDPEFVRRQLEALQYEDKALEAMKKRKPKVKDTRRFTLEGSMAPNYIPFMEGRPKRDNPINKDDIVNLAIALHKCRTLNEFFKRV